MRASAIERNTSETKISVALDLDGFGAARISTGVGFFDHMLDQIARHAPLDLEVAATGDLHIDAHHTVEDVGITFGQAVNKALGDRKGIARYGDAHVPLDEALTRVVVDISGRPYLVYGLKFPSPEDRRIRHRARSRVFSGRRGSRRDRAAYRHVGGRQQPSRRGERLQGIRARLRQSRGARSSPLGRSLDQGRPE